MIGSPNLRSGIPLCEAGRKQLAPGRPLIVLGFMGRPGPPPRCQRHIGPGILIEIFVQRHIYALASRDRQLGLSRSTPRNATLSRLQRLALTRQKLFPDMASARSLTCSNFTESGGFLGLRPSEWGDMAIKRTGVKAAIIWSFNPRDLTENHPLRMIFRTNSPVLSR